MNFRGIFYYLGLFCFPLSFLSFLNILYSSYFDYFLNIESYAVTLFLSLVFGFLFYLSGKNKDKKVNFYEQIVLIIIIYITTSLIVSIPYYLSNYQITFINSIFEAFSGITGTGFTIFENIKYLDPTLILWRSSSQWIGGLYFLIFLILFFSNSKFNYKLNNLVFISDKSFDPETNIKKISLKIFFIYSILSVLMFSAFSLSGIRLFDSLNLSMSLVSAGGFLPTNNLNLIIRNNFQEIILVVAFIISMLNIFFIFNMLNLKNLVKIHTEDFAILFLAFSFSLVFFVSIENLNFLEVLSVILSSISNSGISMSSVPNNFSLFLLFLTLIGGSLISNTSGIKFIRIYILLKSSFFEIFRLVRPNNIINKNILFSSNKINNEYTKISFLIFISFFISLFILSGILVLDNIDFENSFKLSILTITNTATSGLYGLTGVDFKNLLTSSKVFIIIFMVIGKIELISIFLIIKKIFFRG
jgi:trk system potassium uptake protein